MQKVRRHKIYLLRLLVSTGFQILFTLFFRVLFTFPSRYFTLLVIKKYLDLEGGPPIFKQNYTQSVLLIIFIKYVKYNTIQGFHFLWQIIPNFSNTKISHILIKKSNPGSLATTTRISVDFFSSSYLDVSVRQVIYIFIRFPFLNIQEIYSFKVFFYL